MGNSQTVFDRHLVRRHRDRAASKFTQHDFLFRAVGETLLDRLDDMSATFPVALELGCRTGILGRLHGGRAGITTWISTDLSPAMVAQADAPRLVMDEEFLAIEPGSLDLVVSNLSLHWVNDLPGALLQIRQALKPDGLFIASLWGGDTLMELRRAVFEAELEETGGVSPRFSPLTDLPDLGMLLQRAGFALPVVDSDRLTVTYGKVETLFADLRGMAETNAVIERPRSPLPRRVRARAASTLYDEAMPQDGRIQMTFQTLFMTGWAPAPSQQVPLRRGSAETPLAQALGNGKPH